MESSDTTQLPNKGDLFVFSENPDETLILSLGYGIGNETSHVTVFSYDGDSNRWLKLQKMHFKKDYIEPYITNKTLYLIGCSSDCKKISFENRFFLSLLFRFIFQLSVQFTNGTTHILLGISNCPTISLKLSIQSTRDTT
jgi:hypothetical protein